MQEAPRWLRSGAQGSQSPNAELTGLDSSPQMVAAAQRDFPGCRWVVGDIASWSTAVSDSFDVVFSNAALQWVANHATAYPRLMQRVAPGGAFAAQVPNNL